MLLTYMFSFGSNSVSDVNGEVKMELLRSRSS